MSSDTIEIDGDEHAVSDLVFVSLVGSGLVIQHQGWAREEMQGPGQVPPDPMDFGDDESYTPRNATEAKELLGHPHRAGNRGAEDWFILYDSDEEESVEPTEEALDQIPEGYAKVGGELVPVDELTGGSPDDESPPEGDEGYGRDEEGREALTAPEGETITTKQEAYEALAAAGVDLSADDAPNMSDGKQTILEYAHAQGYYFPNYE